MNGQVHPPGPANTAGNEVSCYHCLGRIPWPAAESTQGLWRWDGRTYQPLSAQEVTTREAWQRASVKAHVICPTSASNGGPHYLPYAYGRYGKPLVVGFVGSSSSGKSHLLSAMVQAIDAGGLTAHGVSARPLDLVVHGKFVEENVRPLFVDHRELLATGEGKVDFADAFVVTESVAGRTGGRVVALFDVAGEDLDSTQEAKQFLLLADALIFVADPVLFVTASGRAMGDPTFGTVLSTLAEVGRLPGVHAAIVVNKADLVGFDEPLAMWLRREEDLDERRVLRESEDVYSYLHSRGAQAWTRPYQECARATLHVASATGSAMTGNRFVRGVTPRRVLGPLLAVLAMTGAISSGPAGRIGT